MITDVRDEMIYFQPDRSEAAIAKDGSTRTAVQKAPDMFRSVDEPASRAGTMSAR